MHTRRVAPSRAFTGAGAGSRRRSFSKQVPAAAESGRGSSSHFSRVGETLRGIGESLGEAARAPPEREVSDEAPRTLAETLRREEPLDVDGLMPNTSVEAQSAMQRTVSGMLGTLPRESFTVRISMEREALRRLLVSAALTGYKLHAAELRLTLQRGFSVADEADDAPLGMSGFPEGLESCVPDSDDERSSSEGDMLRGLPCEVRDHLWEMQQRLAAAEKRAAEAEAKLAEAAKQAQAVDASAAMPDLLAFVRVLEANDESVMAISTEAEAALREMADNLIGALPGVADLPGCEGDNAPAALYFETNVTASRDYLQRAMLWTMLMGYRANSVELALHLDVFNGM